MEDGQHAIAAPQISFLERYAKLGLLHAFVAGTTVVQHFRTEAFHVDGLEHLATTDSAGTPKFRIPGPYLFLGQHVSWDDFVNLPPIWDMFPEKILFTGPSRNDYIKELFPDSAFLGTIGDGVVNSLFGLLFFPVYRTWTVQNPSEEVLKKMQMHNQTTLEHVVRAYQNSINIAIMPEGTTKTDGRIAKIRSGAYTYATMTDIKPYCIPFGNTYDYFAGNKPHVFVRFGIPYKHKAVPSLEGEHPEEYRKRDMASFNSRIRESFIDLNTITATQLVSVVLYDLLDKKYPLNKSGLAFIIQDFVGLLRDAHVSVDPALGDENVVLQRVGVVMDALEREGYITYNNSETIQVKRGRALREPQRFEDYKKENMLLYQYHKLREVAEARPLIAGILGQRLKGIPQY